MTDIELLVFFKLPPGAPKAKKWLIVPKSNTAYFLMFCRLVSTVHSRFSDHGAVLCTLVKISLAACVYPDVRGWLTHD